MNPELKLRAFIGDLFISKLAAEAKIEELQKQLDDLKNPKPAEG